MADTLPCPLCCNKSFASKQLLIEHLNNIVNCLLCPVCNNKSTSLLDLIQHLTFNNCSNINTNNVQNMSLNALDIGEALKLSVINETSNLAVGDQVNEMFVQPQLQTHDLKLVKDSSGRYLLVTQTNLPNPVVTQNSDGTISLNAVKEVKVEHTKNEPVKVEEDTLIAPSENDTDDTEELYSCNTCGVTFTSVLEHIQNYHTDQDVVLAEQTEENSDSASMSDSYENSPTNLIQDVIETNINTKNNDDDNDSNTEEDYPRRMITEAGNIIVAPLKEDSESKTNDNLSISVAVKKPTPSKKQNKIKTSNQNSEGNNEDKTLLYGSPYHKVVFKEVTDDSGKKTMVYNCVSCSVYVATLDEFKQHPCQRVVQLAKDNKYNCSSCNTIFHTNKSLKLHQRMHLPIRPRIIEAPVEVPPGTKLSQDQYLCSVCNKLIPINYKTVHLNSHKTNNIFYCEICNRRFKSSEYLEMHMSIHRTEKSPKKKNETSLPYSCTFCTRQFARPHEKVKHERIHTGEKPHSCEICGKSFRVSYCLTLHMRTHTGARPYECSHCGKRYKSYSVYNHHLLTHSDVRGYKCPFCPKAFKTAVQLAGHKNSHTKPFSCQHCNRPFASLYAVRVHTETHNRLNNLKYKCRICGASYARIFALKDHVKAAHADVVYPFDTPPESTVQPEVEITVKDDDSAVLVKQVEKLPQDQVSEDFYMRISTLDTLNQEEEVV